MINDLLVIAGALALVVLALPILIILMAGSPILIGVILFIWMVS